MEENSADLPKVALARMDGLAWGILLLIGIQLLSDIRTSKAPVDQQTLIGSYQYKIDLRTASIAELQVVPGFGPTLSRRWVEDRERLLSENESVYEAFQAMNGIGKEKFKALLPYLLEDKPTSGDNQ